MSLKMSSTRIRHGLLVAIGFAALSLSSAMLYAQEAAPAATEEAAPVETSLMDKIVDGGIFMVPIGILSVWMITLTVFMILQLSRKKFLPPTLKDEVLAFMADVRVRSSIDVAAQSPSYFGRMVASAYPLVDATDPESLGRRQVEDAIADYSVRENSRYMSWIGYFSVIAQGAPMLGLFGTVAGMVLAFDTMGLSGGSDPGALAANISLALMTTAGGLVVAIPSIFLFYAFKNRFNSLVGECQAVAIEGLEAAIATVNVDQALAKVPEGISEG